METIHISVSPAPCVTFDCDRAEFGHCRVSVSISDSGNFQNWNSDFPASLRFFLRCILDPCHFQNSRRWNERNALRQGRFGGIFFLVSEIRYLSLPKLLRNRPFYKNALRTNPLLVTSTTKTYPPVICTRLRMGFLLNGRFQAKLFRTAVILNFILLTCPF